MTRRAECGGDKGDEYGLFKSRRFGAILLLVGAVVFVPIALFLGPVRSLVTEQHIVSLPVEGQTLQAKRRLAFAASPHETETG